MGDPGQAGAHREETWAITLYNTQGIQRAKVLGPGVLTVERLVARNTHCLPEAEHPIPLSPAMCQNM